VFNVSLGCWRCFVPSSLFLSAGINGGGWGGEGRACSLEGGGAVHKVGTVNTVPAERIVKLFV
jgi:hypothetical protein